MKFINSFCGTVTVFIVLLIAAYSGIAIGDNLVEELYTVTINGIPLRRDAAENVLLRINGNYKREGINARNNTQETGIQLKKIEKGMDISIEDSGLLSDLSNLYENRGGECGSVSGECTLDNKEFKGKTRRIRMDISNGVVSSLAVF
ncbi:MAG: hypothetical protein LBB06_01345 [Endomicrobium sp.]|jgi:hypothetical protein|nr:hypothetical protein [Endomicrobium sp.]